MSSDSLNLLAYEAGLVATPLEEQAASAAQDLCTEQQLMRVGDPLPLVFCRRQGDVGGVLVSPPATEARFANDTSNVLTASWHLVVSEGPIDPIQARDVFQCACRVGTSTQTFGKRAGTWSPGNVTVDRGGTYKRWDVPRFCGSPGTYDELHCVSFVNTYADGEEWNRQVHLFLRGGRHVRRLVDGVVGPTSNVVDIYLLLLQKLERVPANLIDIDNLRHAALFTEGLGMRFDGKFTRDATQNLDDWCENVLKPYFLLTRTRVAGREGLMPLLPTNPDGSLYTGVVAPHATLSELDLDLETWDLQFLSLADRRPICAQMMWRQQGDGIDSIVRTSEVRFRPPYNAPDGPFEQHDLSEFACSERHVAKAGAYAVAHRALVHHTLKVAAIPGDYNRTIGDGYIVRVRVPRVVDGQAAATHDYLYRVVSIEKSLAGDTVFNLVHFPLDAEGRSAVAMAVQSAQPSGLVLPITVTGPVCDVNSNNDTTALPDDSFGDDYWDLPESQMYDIEIPDGGLLDPDGEGMEIDGGGGGGDGGIPGGLPGPDGPEPPGPDGPVPPGPGPGPGPGSGDDLPDVPPGCRLTYRRYTDEFGREAVEYVVECPPERKPNEKQPNPDKRTPPPGSPPGRQLIGPQDNPNLENEEIFIKYRFKVVVKDQIRCYPFSNPLFGVGPFEAGSVAREGITFYMPTKGEPRLWQGRGFGISWRDRSANLKFTCGSVAQGNIDARQRELAGKMAEEDRPGWTFVGFDILASGPGGTFILDTLGMYAENATYVSKTEPFFTGPIQNTLDMTVTLEILQLTIGGRDFTP